MMGAATTGMSILRRSRIDWVFQAQRLEASEVTGENLRAYQAVLLGSLGDDCVSDTLLNALRAWVRRGGRLLAFGTRGLDAWLGLDASGTLYQPDDYSARATPSLVGRQQACR